MNTWDGANYPITRFLSETGVESMASERAWRQSTNVTDDLNYMGEFVVNRDHHSDGQHQMMYVSTFCLDIIFIRTRFVLVWKLSIIYHYQ